MRVQFLGQEDPLEEEMATHSSILAWRIPWTEEHGGLQSIGSQRIGHDWSNLAQDDVSISIYLLSIYIYLSEKAMATHSSTLAWKIPWTEKPGTLQSMGSQRVGHDWVTSLSLFTFHFHALGKEMATDSSVLAWRIPGTGKPGGLPSMESHRVGHNWSNLAAAAAALEKGIATHSSILA